MFGALDLDGQLSCMIASRKRSKEFLEFLRWLVHSVYPDSERIYLFMDNCSIHKTKAVQAFLRDHRHCVTVIWNAPYAPNLNEIELVWGQLKRAFLNNHYFSTVENLEEAALRAVREHNKSARKRNERPVFHSLRGAA